jgi:peptidoglycan/LPS O-acetylase OafA/YrhL
MEPENYTKTESEGFVRCVLIEGLLKIGTIAVIVYLLIDFAVEFIFIGDSVQYSAYYYIWTIFWSMSLGLTIGLINWFRLRRNRSNSRHVNDTL